MPESGAGCLPVVLGRTGGGLVKGWEGLVEDEEDWWKRNGVSCQNLKHKLVMKTGEDWRDLWVFWSAGLLGRGDLLHKLNWDLGEA